MNLFRRFKKVLLVTLLSIMIGNSAYGQTHNWNRVIRAIAKVESNFNESARNGSHVGYLQIAPILVQDCNRILKSRGAKKTFTLKDRYSKEKSIEMFCLIQDYYNPKHNVEKAIRLWNGGPSYSAKSTNGYYRKVMRYYSQEEEE